MPPTTDSASALKNLQSYQASLQTPQQVADAANKALGVDAAGANVQGLRGAIQRTTGLLQQVAPSVYGRTGGSLVTQAQATRQIGNESAPIQQNLQNEGQNLSTASEDYRDLLGKAQAQASNELQGQQGQLGFLQQIYQNLYGQEQGAKDEAFRQAQLAEQKRQADLSAATSRANAASGAGLSMDAIAKYLDQFIASQNKAGGPSQAQVNAALTLKNLGGPVGSKTNTANPTNAIGKLGMDKNKVNTMPSWLRSWLGI